MASFVKRLFLRMHKLDWIADRAKKRGDMNRHRLASMLRDRLYRKLRNVN